MKRLLTLTLTLILALTALPVHADGGARHTVAFDGFSFSYDAALGRVVSIQLTPGDPLEWEAPGGPQPAHVEFGIGHEPLTDWYAFTAPVAVRVYRLSDIAPYAWSQAAVEALAELLRTRPDLAPYMAPESIASQTLLPFLPVLPALQVVRAQAQYVDLPTLSGIRFVTTYRQSAEPFMGDEFFYTFQGLSADRQYYVSMIALMDSDILSNEIAADFNYDAWFASLDTYYAEAMATLNGAAPNAFTPSLDVFDALVSSMAFAG